MNWGAKRNTKDKTIGLSGKLGVCQYTIPTAHQKQGGPETQDTPLKIHVPWSFELSDSQEADNGLISDFQRNRFSYMNTSEPGHRVQPPPDQMVSLATPLIKMLSFSPNIQR